MNTEAIQEKAVQLKREETIQALQADDTRFWRAFSGTIFAFLLTLCCVLQEPELFNQSPALLLMGGAISLLLSSIMWPLAFLLFGWNWNEYLSALLHDAALRSSLGMLPFTLLYIWLVFKPRHGQAAGSPKATGMASWLFTLGAIGMLFYLNKLIGTSGNELQRCLLYLAAFVVFVSTSLSMLLDAGKSRAGVREERRKETRKKQEKYLSEA